MALESMVGHSLSSTMCFYPYTFTVVVIVIVIITIIIINIVIIIVIAIVSNYSPWERHTPKA